MAGDWLKMECATPDKPEVLALTVKMGWDDPDLTVGKLFRLWRWFDQQTTDGNAHGVTPALLDKQVGVTGFIEAMAAVGWLVIHKDGVHLKDFEKHNGATAKSRAQTAKRVNKFKGNAKGNADTVTPSVTEALPREEKRREEKNHPTGGVRATRKCPDSFVVTEILMAWAAKNAPDVEVDKATDRFRDYTFKNAMTDWDGAWRNWLRKDQEDAGKVRGGGKQVALEAENARVAKIWAGAI